MLISLLLGTIRRLSRRLVDQAIMRTLDVLFAFPLVLLAIAIAGVLQPGVRHADRGDHGRAGALHLAHRPQLDGVGQGAALSSRRRRPAAPAPLDILVRYVLPNILRR